MSDLFENALNSIKLGIDDYQSNDDRRPVSAIRNFYAGVLLLGKECLVRAAPDADPMDIIASHYRPVPDENGGLIHEPKGYSTIDLNEMRNRFKSFGIDWPEGDIKSLQKLRNDFEHFHSVAPTEKIRQAIAGCFPLVEGFFRNLEEDPAVALGEAWEVMLAEEAFFNRQKQECNSSFEKLPWGDSLSNTNEIACSNCGSTLIYQQDKGNSDPASIRGKCLACGEAITAEATVKLIVDAEHGVDDYISVKDGAEQIIHDCPECCEPTYVSGGDVNFCYFCDFSVEGECARCMCGLTVENQSVNNPNLCDYCDHMAEKIMRE